MKFEKKRRTWIVMLLVLIEASLFLLIISTSEAQLNQNQPPTVTIITPEEKGLYFRDIRLFPAVRILIFGYVTIKASATDDNGVKQVEFYIDGILRNVSTSTHHCGSYMWIWNDRTWIQSRHTIKVVALDNESLVAEDTCDVVSHNFPLLHPLYP